MARGRAGASDGEEIVDDEYDAPRETHRRPARGRTTAYRRARPTTVRRWESSDEEEAPEEWEEQHRWARGKGTREKPPVYWRARDSLYFEPLVALAIIVVLLAGFWGYTGNWPPAYVVESNSMQHGAGDTVGLINAGDIVLAQKVPFGSIVPYVIGLQTRFTTYGEWGDVLIYHRNGNAGETPVIHRAILFLEWNPVNDTYNASDLAGLPCGTEVGAVWATPGTRLGGQNGCGYIGLGAANQLDLYRIGWQSLNLTIQTGAPALGGHSGFVTLGDNNTGIDQAGTGVAVTSSLVEPGWIVGVARGMIPWFGSVKLLLDGNAGYVPSASWEFLGLTIAGIILLAFALHYALRREGFLSRLRRQEEEERAPVDDWDEEERPPGRVRRFFGALRPWRSDDYDPTEEADRPRRSPPARAHREADRVPPRRGRPRPYVGPRERRKDDDR